MQNKYKALLFLSITFLCNSIVVAEQKPMVLDFVNQQQSTQKLNKLRAMSTPELITAQAEYYQKMHKALIESGFTKEEALKIVIALASSDK